MTPAGTSNELDNQNGWEENTHTHTVDALFVGYYLYFSQIPFFEVVILRAVLYLFLYIVGVRARRTIFVELGGNEFSGQGT